MLASSIVAASACYCLLPLLRSKAKWQPKIRSSVLPQFLGQRLNTTTTTEIGSTCGSETDNIISNGRTAAAMAKSASVSWIVPPLPLPSPFPTFAGRGGWRKSMNSFNCIASSSSSSALATVRVQSEIRTRPRRCHGGGGVALGLKRPWPWRRARARAGVGVCVLAMFERFAERSVRSVVLAQKEAMFLRCDAVDIPHVLLGLIHEESASVSGYLGSGLRIDNAREAARLVWNYGDPVQAQGSSDSDSHNKTCTSRDIPFSRESKLLFASAVDTSRKTGHKYIFPEHISSVILSLRDGRVSSFFESMGFQMEELSSVAASRLKRHLPKEVQDATSTSASQPAMSGADAVIKYEEKTKRHGVLFEFCVDVTELAQEGKIDPVVGREQEVERVIQVLIRKTKNNPLLLGEPGVGKTAIAEGLALRIVEGEIPIQLQGKQVMSLDITSLMSGSKERGELESRVIDLIEEIRRKGNVILVVDEAHNIVQSGKSKKSNIANLLKPALARGQLQCIAATTFDEYRRYMEMDKALARRFQPIKVQEPSQEDAVKILNGVLDKYEKHHKCIFASEAVDAAVHLSERYIANRYLPDKAIDLIDEAGSRANINASNTRKQEQAKVLDKLPSEYWKEIHAINKLYERQDQPAKTNQNQEESNESEQSLTSFNVDGNSDSSSHENKESNSATVVRQNDIAAIASAWSGIPLEQLTSDEKLKLLDLENKLQTRIVGQYEAVNVVAKAVRRARVGLKDPNRPIASLLFCGPTGVGKTAVAKALAKIYFGSEAAMIRLDMSEYMERHSVSRLIGSPPGYVGCHEGGVLTEGVRHKPFTIILLDEIEKAHRDLYNILLQIFEDGHLSDSQGRKVSFKNTLIIMTSNVGSTAVAKTQGRGLVFTPGQGNSATNQLKSLLMQELRVHFRPELLNRIDELVVFNPLKKSQVRRVVEIMLKETGERLSKQWGIHLEVSEAVLNLICKQGYDYRYGARSLKRALTLLVEDVVSEAFLKDEYQSGDRVLVDVDESGNTDTVVVVTRHVQPHPHSCQISVLTDGW